MALGGTMPLLIVSTGLKINEFSDTSLKFPRLLPLVFPAQSGLRELFFNYKSLGSYSA